MKKLSILFLSLLIVASCNKDDDNEKEAEKSSVKEITSFIFFATDNETLSEDVKGIIDEDKKTITAEVPFSTAITALKPTTEISSKAVLNPKGKVITDFTKPLDYIVTAEDGTTQKYTVTITVGKSNIKKINTFTFLVSDNDVLFEDVEATIDENEKTITAEVPFGTDITALKPEIMISEKATLGPKSKVANNFSEEVDYTVTAEDGSTTKYKVNLSIGKSSEKAITSFTFLVENNDNLSQDLEAVVNETNKTITAEVPYGTALTALKPTIAVSERANVTPGNKIETNFSEAVNYIVTAEDASNVEYSVTITVTAPTEREVLILLYNANQGNTLGWDLEEEDISNWKGVILENDRVTELYLDDNSLTSIPAEVGNLTNLSILVLDDNLLTSIPVEIGKLMNLQGLYFNNNSLDSIPAEIGNLTKLITLGLNQNSLTSIPSEIGKLMKLENLAMGFNSLTSIPTEIGNLSNLKRLNLHHNSLTSIPSEVGKLTNLELLWLSNNQITSIPKVICDLNIGIFSKDDTAICE